MSLVQDKTGLQYRNPYCAICNYVDIEDIDCVHLDGRRRGGGHAGVGFRLIKLFYLKDKRCEKDMVYDKFHDVCRCNARISIMKDGKCVYKIPEMKERKKKRNDPITFFNFYQHLISSKSKIFFLFQKIRKPNFAIHIALSVIC
ncbi:hypothetical protein CEXT_454501 [Caerostris extrusa]|uniref:Uncharacterized protein n=1 Tax=Caerostris extrusa TaxID=172846 RepID=A0AAV4M3A8_CAEEX|nr:hypothetical protein CEXT_454501 [Caerostris extrusa]